MEVNKNENISSFFDSLDEWLNDENRIVRTIVYIEYTGIQSFHFLFSHVVKYDNALSSCLPDCNLKRKWNSS